MNSSINLWLKCKNIIFYPTCFVFEYFESKFLEKKGIRERERENINYNTCNRWKWVCWIDSNFLCEMTIQENYNTIKGIQKTNAKVYV